MIRILIADDIDIVRQGFKRILEKSGEMKVVADFNNGSDALKWLDHEDCDIVLLDISLPGMNGVDVLRQLQYRQRKVPVIIISVYSIDQYAVRLIRAGACGYLNKECAPENLVEAVRHVTNGGKYISPEVAEMLSNEVVDANEKSPHSSLSDREYQIFLLFASAKSASEIANFIAVSEKTVNTYRSLILEKLHLRSIADLMHYAVKNHLTQ